jgi:hypothetical protein
MGTVLVTAAHGSDHRCGQRPSERVYSSFRHPVSLQILQYFGNCPLIMLVANARCCYQRKSMRA